MNARIIAASLAACAVSAAAPASAQDALDTWTVPSEPRFSIGGADERDGYRLAQVNGAALLSDGRLVVADGRTAEVRYYSPEGEHVRSSPPEWGAAVVASTHGGAPEAVWRLDGIVALPGDTVLASYVSDRHAWWGPDGSLARSVRVAPGTSRPDLLCRGSGNAWHALADGSLLRVHGESPSYARCSPPRAALWRESVLLSRTDLATARFDTLGIVPGSEWHTPFERVFGATLQFTWDSSSVFVSDTGSPEIVRLSFEGDTLAVWSTPFELEPVPAEARQREYREFDRGGARERSNAYLYPDHYPRLGRLLMGRTGELWVMAYPRSLEPVRSRRLSYRPEPTIEPGGARWRVLDASGEPIAEVRTPDGVFPLEVGHDHLIGLLRDDSGRETVAVYDLVR